MIRGMTAPPLMALIISPEISLDRLGYFSTAMEKTRGQILATNIPIRNTSTHAAAAEEIMSIAIRARMPRNEVPIRNLREDNLVRINAPVKVPSIRPKK